MKMGGDKFIKRQIIGINFFSGSEQTTLDVALKGGLLVAPAAPNLANHLINSATYRDALINADTVIIDSSYLTLLWWMRTFERLRKYSGLAFLRAFLRHKKKKDKKTMWIMPSEEEKFRTIKCLKSNKIPTRRDDYYIAPVYDHENITDDILKNIIENKQPEVIIVGLGGGVQEQLGLFLRRNLSYKPSIFCIGAAIAFLTGGQGSIPVWADKLSLGWLFRIIHNPRHFVKRYAKAFKLASIVFRWKDALPPLVAPD